MRNVQDRVLTRHRGDRLVAILWFHSLLDDAERAWLDSLGVELTAGQRQALVVAGRTGFINNSGVRDLIGERGDDGFAPPEQLDGAEAHPSADIFAFGKLLAYLTTGQTDVDQLR